MPNINDFHESHTPQAPKWHAEVNRIADETIRAGRDSMPQIPRLDEKRLLKQRERIRRNLHH